MKKFLAIAVIAASFAACNEKKADETVVTKDTTTVVTPDTTTVVTPDTSKVVTTTTTTVDTMKMEKK